MSVYMSVASVSNRNRVDWWLLVKERIAKIAKQIDFLVFGNAFFGFLANQPSVHSGRVSSRRVCGCGCWYWWQRTDEQIFRKRPFKGAHCSRIELPLRLNASFCGILPWVCRGRWGWGGQPLYFRNNKKKLTYFFKTPWRLMVNRKRMLLDLIHC